MDTRTTNRNEPTVSASIVPVEVLPVDSEFTGSPVSVSLFQAMQASGRSVSLRAPSVSIAELPGRKGIGQGYQRHDLGVCPGGPASSESDLSFAWEHNLELNLCEVA